MAELPRILDKHIDWIRKRIYLSAANPGHQHLITPEIDLIATFGIGELLQFPGAADIANPGYRLKKVGSANSNVVGIGWTGADNGAGIACPIEMFTGFPYDLDVNYAVGVKVNFSSDALGSVSFGAEIIVSEADRSLESPDTIPLSVGNPLSDLVVVDTQYKDQWTNRGYTDAIFSDLPISTLDQYGRWGVRIGVNSVDTLLVTDLTLLGVMLDYVPRKTIGKGNEQDAPLYYPGIGYDY